VDGRQPQLHPPPAEALGVTGDTVEDIFKILQFDIGAPPQFLDFRYSLSDPYHGEFRNDYCGALIDVEPMGVEVVRAMCHTIQDPTFDATAIATNPKARFRPIHRPPREPADRAPHCHWSITVEPDREDLPFPPEALEIAAAEVMSIHLDPIDPCDDASVTTPGRCSPTSGSTSGHVRRLSGWPRKSRSSTTCCRWRSSGRCAAAVMMRRNRPDA